MAVVMETKTWTKEEIREMLQTNPRAVLRGVVAIFRLQTAEEQALGFTENKNGVGFNSFDAEIMTSFARQILAGRTLTAKQFAIARNKIMKYAGQLAAIANGEL